MAITSFTGKFRFLSNFWPCAIVFENRVYQNVEAAYQAAKTTDPEVKKRFAWLAANEAKKLGRTIKVRSDWEDTKVEVMRLLVKDKFFRHIELGDSLLRTGDEALVEGNYWGDRFWGQCPLGNGQNILGKLLMEIRALLLIERGKDGGL